ncbi:hypothetical protein HGO92_22455 [Arthrobacter sp. SF27]|nr:hypothetical protein [Arthrobacter sp. SF27]
MLRQFYPALLQAGSVWQNGLARPEIRELLRIAPTPAAAARLSTARIEAALRRAGRSRGIAAQAPRIKLILRGDHARQPRPSKTPWATRFPGFCSFSMLAAKPSTS